MTLDPAWQKETALRKARIYRAELIAAQRPVTDRQCAEIGASYVGAEVQTVLGWIAEARKAAA